MENYLGNPNLKKVNTPVEFTEEQILEYQKFIRKNFYLFKACIKLLDLIKEMKIIHN